jgi:hypothetical protein
LRASPVRRITIVTIVACHTDDAQRAREKRRVQEREYAKAAPFFNFRAGLLRGFSGGRAAITSHHRDWRNAPAFDVEADAATSSSCHVSGRDERGVDAGGDVRACRDFRA